jgi:putative transposase
MELSERVYRCEACGLVIDRDYNAAINIKNEGLRMLAGA